MIFQRSIFHRSSIRCRLLAVLLILVICAYLGTHQSPTSLNSNLPKERTHMTSSFKDSTINVHHRCPLKTFDTTNWTSPVLPGVLQDVGPTNADLLDHLCDRWIIPPFHGPRNLKQPSKLHYSQGGQSLFVDKLLKQKQNGFFIECGAASGEELSNSLFFEKSRNWSGLLIEANSNLFKSVLHTRRHAYMLNACLSPKKSPMLLKFTEASFLGGLTDLIDDTHKKRIHKALGNVKSPSVQCFPLEAVLRAINVTHVDYFSLDIEGAEPQVLESFPFDEIKVDVISVEYFIPDNLKESKRRKERIKQFMSQKFGYVVTPYPGNDDLILAKNILQ